MATKFMRTLAAVAVVGFVGSLPVVAQTTSKPNIVYVLVDNWGWGDISIQGSTIQTPRIDAFAVEGMRFTNFNVQNQCTPTRSALMTGRLPIRSGTQKVSAPGEPDGLAHWEYTIAELLSDSGYATACRHQAGGRSQLQSTGFPGGGLTHTGPSPFLPSISSLRRAQQVQLPQSHRPWAGSSSCFPWRCF